MTMDIQRVESFQQDQPVILEQPAFWTRAFIWLIVVMTASTLIWAALAKIDHAIPAQGKLEPEGSLKELDAPVGGVVKEIHVKGGDKVKKGDLLITFDPTTSEADVESLKARKEAVEETKDAIRGGGSVGGPQANLDSLRQRRDALASENEFLRAQVNGGDPGGLVGGAFDDNQRQLLNANRQEVESRARAGTAEVQTLREQLEQTKIQRQSSIDRLPLEQSALASARDRLVSTEAQIGTSQLRLGSTQDRLGSNQDRLSSTQERLVTARERLLGAQDRLVQAQQRAANARERLAKEQEILDRIRPVVEQGAVAELQLNRQEQQVLTAQDAVVAAESEISSAQDQIAANQASISATEGEISAVLGDSSSTEGEIASAQGAIDSTLAEISGLKSDIAEREARISDTQKEIERLSKEELRIQAQIAQAEARLDNSLDNTDKDALARISANQQQIAQIDDQLTQLRLSTQQQSAEVTGELTKAEQALAYRELRSPIDGVIFKLSPKSVGYVISQAEQEPVVSILPDSLLKAAVEVTNKDIGFIKTGMEVEVQIDAFPATEFGTVPGKLTSIGEDVLPPDPEHNYYRFPVTVTLGQQFIDVGKEDEKIPIKLKSGMSVRANIKVRNRTVLSIFLDKFSSQKEVFKEMR
jgi:hemolysin D